MNGQKLEQEVVQSLLTRGDSQQQEASVEQPTPLTYESAEDSLQLLLERFTEYFRGRAERDDSETLAFCLRQLYSCITTLLQQTLPSLTRATVTQRQPVTSALARRHAVWVQLQAMLLLLERVESHSHLLLSTTTSVLGVLDTTEDAAPVLNAASSVGTEAWQRAYEVLSASLRAWQGQQKTILCFHTTFVSVIDPAVVALLTQMDIALTMFFDCANAIFGDIIPDVQLVAQGDDEIVATLLFDLMQQNDLLLMQIGKLVEPLQQLIKHYVVTE